MLTGVKLREIGGICLKDSALLLIPIDKIPKYKESEIVVPDQLDRYRCGVAVRSVRSILGGDKPFCKKGDIVVFKMGSGSDIGVFTSNANNIYEQLRKIGLDPVPKLVSVGLDDIIAIIGEVNIG